MSNRVRRNIGKVVLVLLLAVVAMPAAASERGPETGLEVEIGIWAWLTDTVDVVTGWFSPTTETFEGLSAKTSVGAGVNFGAVGAGPGPEVTRGETHDALDPNG